MRLYHVTPAANLAQIQQDGLEPRIGPRAELLAESVPAVYGFPTREDCEDALLNWLGDQFSEGEPLVVLELDVAGLSLAKTVVSWERAVLEPVAPARIQAVHTEEAFYGLSDLDAQDEHPRAKAA